MENQEEKEVEEVQEEQETSETEKEEKRQSQSVSEPIKKPGLYTAGLVCGIVGLCLFWSAWIGLICGILGIVFGAVAYNKGYKKKIPMILGGIATGLAIVMMVVYSFIISMGAKELEKTANKWIDNIEEKYEESKEKLDEDNEEKEQEVQEKTDDSNSLTSEVDEATKKAEDIINSITN